MIPLLIGAAVVGGIGYALSDNDKSSTKVYYTDDGDRWYCEETRCEIPESEVPANIRRKVKNLHGESNDELLLAEGFDEIPARKVPADILAKAKRCR